MIKVTVIFGHGLNSWCCEVSEEAAACELYNAFCSGSDNELDFVELRFNNEEIIYDEQPLYSYGIRHNDIIYAKIHENTEMPNFDEVGLALIQACKADLSKRRQYTNTWREMDEAIGRDDVSTVSRLLEADFMRTKAEKDQYIQAVRDPTTPGNAKLLDDYRKQQRIDESLEQCMDENPEMFGKVAMLYVNVIINQRRVKAFVDSGAQMTIISRAYADRCGLGDLLDTRFSGTATGVGVQRVLGRIHRCAIQIGGAEFNTAVAVMEHQPMGLIIGLDFLRRNQCNIDIVSNELHLGAGRLSTPFLPESELPMHAKTTVTEHMSEEAEELFDLNDMVEVLSDDNRRKIVNLAKVGKCDKAEAKDLLHRHRWNMSAAMLDLLTEKIANSALKLTLRQKREQRFRQNK